MNYDKKNIETREQTTGTNKRKRMRRKRDAATNFNEIGYAIGTSEGLDNGFYVRSVLGLDIANRVEINTFYHLVTADGGNFGSIGLGLLFEFGPNQ